MSKQKVIDYVFETPYNTNPAILNQLLDEMINENCDSEEEEEVWATYLQEEDTAEYKSNKLTLYYSDEELQCDSGVTTTKTNIEWMNFVMQADGKYKAKIKGYFSDLPNIEMDVIYAGSLEGWRCDYGEKYNDNYEYYGEGEIEADSDGGDIGFQCRYYDINNNTYIYPTKIEFIVCKQ